MDMKKLTASVRTIFLSVTALVAGQAAAEDLPRLDVEVFQDAIESASNMPRLHSLLISQDGYLVLERYFNGRDAWRTANVKSVSKSIMSALIGIAIEKGHLAGTDQTIADYYGDVLPPEKQRITIGNLLSMQAGLETIGSVLPWNSRCWHSPVRGCSTARATRTFCPTS